jgi:hypothetical protein
VKRFTSDQKNDVVARFRSARVWLNGKPLASTRTMGFDSRMRVLQFGGCGVDSAGGTSTGQPGQIARAAFPLDTFGLPTLEILGQGIKQSSIPLRLRSLRAQGAT